MRYRTPLLGMSALLAVCVAPCFAQSNDQCRINGQQALSAFTQGHYDHAVTHFAPAVAAKVPPDRLKNIWEQLQSAGGEFHALGNLQPSKVENVDVWTATLTFAHLNLAAVVACDAQNRISTFRIVPADADSHAQTPTSQSGNARALDVPSPVGALPGTLVVPNGNGPFPAVVMIIGSGPHDRDETVGPNKPFRDIAEGLAAAGIASFRYDKRTYARATQISGKDITVDKEVTDDAVTAARLLAQQASIDPKRVFVLGHSLGALMAPRISERDPQLAGVIMLAAPTSFGLDTIIKQTRYQLTQRGASTSVIDRQLAPLIQQRDQLAHADPAHPPAGDFFHAPAAYWLSLRDYDAVETAQHLNVPMLILQGGADVQVFPKQDFAAWQKAFAHNSRVTLIEYPGLFHLFMPAGNPASPGDYDKPGHVDPKVIHDIAAWIDAQPSHS